MQIATVLFQQIAIMFALMAIGFLLRRTELLGDESSRDLGKVLINLVLPAVIVRSFWTTAGDGRAVELAQAFALSALLLGLSMLVGHVLQRRHPVADFSVAFSNAGFIGIPLTQAVLGDAAVFYISPFIALLNVLQWTYGQHLLSGSQQRFDAKKVLLSPMLVALVLGLVLYITEAPFPTFARILMEDVSALNTPLAMIVLGCFLAESDIRALACTASLYGVAVERLLVVPLLSIGALALLPGARELKLALLLAAAAPTGTNVAIFAKQHEGDYGYACGCVCLSTLGSLVTMPLIAMVGAGVL